MRLGIRRFRLASVQKTTILSVVLQPALTTVACMEPMHHASPRKSMGPIDRPGRDQTANSLISTGQPAGAAGPMVPRCALPLAAAMFAALLSPVRLQPLLDVAVQDQCPDCGGEDTAPPPGQFDFYYLVRYGFFKGEAS